MTVTFSLTDIGLFALGWLLARWVLLPLLRVLWRAARDTCKWRLRHVKRGHSRWTLVRWYPVLFWENLRDHATAEWTGVELTLSPCELTPEERR